MPNPYLRPWLLLCLLLVALMVALGGYTRLSGSGLSITQWKPIHGTIPPLDEQAWQEEFDAYRQTPQYALVNKGMQLSEFKTIFWPEYLHRLLGRAIGLVFFVPLLIFAATRSLPRPLFFRLAAIFALGGLQGAVGWIMVASGLIDTPYVSHIKLALHLGIAFAIFGLLVWEMMGSFSPSPLEGEGRDGGSISGTPSNESSRTTPHPTFPLKGGRLYSLWLSLLALQILLGALVAGLHAGLVYNTWPDMNGQMIPDGLLEARPWENITLIQFAHRTLAIFVALGFLFWWHSHRAYVNHRLCLAVALLIFAQFALGVLTLVNAVPLNLALAHQMTALCLWGMAVVLLHKLKEI